jgi:hypothetical protein
VGSDPASRLPNFFIAGAPNTGTTSLYFYLRQHPQVYLSPVKEPTFFGAVDLLSGPYSGGILRRTARDRDALRPYLEGRPPRGRQPVVLEWETYLELFRNVRHETAIGEASVRYLLLPAAARAIRARIPHARLIFVLRDPAEWLFMRYLKMFWRDPRGSFSRRLLAAMDPGDAWAPAVAAGCYATHLQRFFDVFPREQMQIHLYEDYQADARAVVREILAFLGVDPEYPIDVSSRHNESVIPRFPLLERFRQWVLGGIPATEWLPLGARRALRQLYYRRRSDLVMDPADRALVIDHYRDEILRASDLIGRDLSAWLR